MYTKLAWRKRQRGFSLYEVLVVIAFVAIAMALLMPTYQRVKQSADSIKCMANLRSWGTSFQMYAAEHDGLYPLSWLNNSDNWTLWIAPYVELDWLSYEGPPTFAKRLDVNKSGCPSFNRVENPNTMYRPFPYSYNAGRFDYPYCIRTHIRGQVIENDIMYPAGWNVPAGTASGIKQRYGTGAWGGEGEDHINNYAHIPPAQLYQEPSSSEVMFCGWASHWRYYAFPYVHWFSSPPAGADYNVRTGDGFMGDYNQMPVGIHGGKDNYLMMDGHVESLKPKDPLVNYYVYNDIPSRGNPWRNFATPGSTWFYPGGVIPKGSDPFP